MKLIPMEPIEPGFNPFRQDLYHMGESLGVTPCGKGKIWRMFPNHPTEKCLYFILINTATGERTKVSFED